MTPAAPGVPGLEHPNPQIEPPATYELPFMLRLDLEPDEEIVFATRQSPLAPLALLWPVAIGLFGWAFLNAASVAIAGQLAPTVIQFGVLGMTVVLALRWLVRDGLGWFLCWFVLTNRRLVVSRGVLRRLRHEADIGRIQTIHVERPNPVANAMNIGDVQVLTASSTGSIWMRGVARPDDIAYTLRLAQQGKLGGHDAADEVAATGVHSPLESPIVRAALDSLLEGDNPEAEPDRSHLLHGSLFRRRIEVALLPGEFIIDRLYRHWFTLVLRLAPPFALGVGVIFILGLVRSFVGGGFGAAWTLMALTGLGVLIWDLLIFSNYMDDVFILTSQRIIDIDREFYIFAEARHEAMYRAIQDVAIKMPLLGRYFGYGNLFVETAGRAPNIEMYNMAHPRRTQERIFALINADKERKAAADLKSQRKELHASVGAVLTALMLATPDLRGLPVTIAATRLRAAGLGVVIAGERPSLHYAPGVVLAQTPGPGATALRGAEVALTLSRRPTATHP